MNELSSERINELGQYCPNLYEAGSLVEQEISP